MKILVAGGAGFIGNHLSRLFIQQEHEVYVIDSLVTGKKKNINDLINVGNFHFIEKDITDFDFSSLPSFDIVYDLASPASPKLFEKIPFEILKVNSLGIFNILDFFVKSKSKIFVFASTSEVYGDPEINPQNEEYFGNVNSFGPRACYDEGKRFAEAVIYTYIKKHDSDIRIARIFNTYGPYMDHDDGRVISNFINQALQNKPLTVYGNGKQTRSPCYVSDMAKGLDLLGKTSGLKGKIINMGNPEEKKVLTLAKIIKKLTRSSSQIEFGEIGENDPQKRRPDISKAIEFLNWEPKISLINGLKLTIDYFRQKKP